MFAEFLRLLLDGGQDQDTVNEIATGVWCPNRVGDRHAIAVFTPLPDGPIQCCVKIFNAETATLLSTETWKLQWVRQPSPELPDHRDLPACSTKTIAESLNEIHAEVGIEDGVVYLIDGNGGEVLKALDWRVLQTNAGPDVRPGPDGMLEVHATRSDDVEAAVYDGQHWS